MRTIAKAAIAAGFFYWTVFATGPLMAQGPYCYFDPKFNATVASRITATIARSGIFLFMDAPISAIQLAILSMEFVVPPVSFFRTAYA